MLPRARTNILEAIGRTPLVKLQRLGKDVAADIYVKCEFMNPGGSMKDRMTLHLVNQAEARAELRPGGTIVEATSGNTGSGLAMIAAVRGYLEQQLIVHEALTELYDDEGDVFVTAGGSAYFDLVAEVYAGAIAADDRTRWTLRSGAYIVHDDGFYRGISPLDAGYEGTHGVLRSAMHGHARVVSHPEPGLALLDGGKRDFPFDEGLPEPQGVAADLGSPVSPLPGATVSAMNDQHTFLRPAEADARIGEVVRLGLSHPCTAFDKWHFLPVVASQDDDRVVELVRTFF